MLKVFPDLNARWLLTGQGKMIENLRAEKKENVKIDIELDSPTSSVSDLERKKQAQTVAKVSAKEDQLTSKADDEDVDKVVLLFRDGTFSSFKRR